MAMVLSAGLAAYFLVGYFLAHNFHPPVTSTVLRATDLTGSWPWARIAWVIAIFLGLAIAVGALVRDRQASMRRRAIIAWLSLLGLVCVIVALPVSPIRPITWAPYYALEPLPFDYSAGYARGVVVSAAAAAFYVALAATHARRRNAH
jgi:hypothetical protein